MQRLHIPKIEALPELLFPNAAKQKLGQLSLYEQEQVALELAVEIPGNIKLGEE